MAEDPADLEISLDRLIGRLAKPGASKEAKAVLVDARRLRTLIGNWRTIQPTEEAQREMVLRVEQLLRTADAFLPPADAFPSAPPVSRASAPRSPSPPPDPAIAYGGPPVEPPIEIGPPPVQTPAVSNTARLRGAAIVEEIRPGAISDPFMRRSLARERPPADPPARTSSDPPARVSSDPPARALSDSPARLSSEPPARAPARPLTTLHSDGESEWDEPPSLIVPARSLVPSLDEPTRAAPIATLVRAGEERAAARAAALEKAQKSDPERLRTLPDLDISGLAQMLDDGQPMGFDEEPLEPLRPTAARTTRDLEALARGRSGSDEPPKRPSPTPPNGRRRADAAAQDPGKSGRLSRILVDENTDADDLPPARPTIARPSSPPARGDNKTLIAVRPLPAPEVNDKRLVMLNEPFSTRADAYRALRRKLSGPGAPKTIAVTSAEPEEGKTMCAANLALAFRETSSERVLLLEANLKAPGLAKLFGFEPPVCFARQMAKNRELTRAPWTVVEQFEPLHVLAVDPSSKTSPLLDPVAFANALEQLVEAGYDHIIVDTPPALGGSDVNLIADAVDGIVVAAWIKKSKKSQVKKAIDQLRPATILGVVTQEG